MGYRRHAYWRPARWQETLYWAFLIVAVLREVRTLEPNEFGFRRGNGIRRITAPVTNHGRKDPCPIPQTRDEKIREVCERCAGDGRLTLRRHGHPPTASAPGVMLERDRTPRSDS